MVVVVFLVFDDFLFIIVSVFVVDGGIINVYVMLL